MNTTQLRFSMNHTTSETNSRSSLTANCSRAIKPQYLALLLVASALLITVTSSFAEQFVLFDVTFPFTQTDALNSTPSQSHYYVREPDLNPKRPVDWTAPVDYRNGTVHVRIEVLEKPAGSQPTTWSICYIPNHGQGNGYGCTNTNVYQEKGVYEKDVPMTSFWENKAIIWSEGVKRMDIVMKDDHNLHAHKRPDPEKFFPTKVHITLVQVSAGSTYDPKLIPNLSKEGAGKSESEKEKGK